MMKYLKFLILGVIFGITLSKAEIISWYRIYEMFRFQSFHMYGVIGSAILLGMLWVQLIRRFNIKTIDGKPVIFNPKQYSIPRYLFGGIIFGFGWAMTGACPGPLFIILGNGIGVIGIAILSAVLGTYVYGILRHKLPH
jgi:hypothetical protein